MKIILTEHQLRYIINEISTETNITVDYNRLNEIIKELKLSGFSSDSKDKNIFNYIDNLQKGDYFIVDGRGENINDVENELLALLDSAKVQSPMDNPPQYFVYKYIPEDNEYIGKGIMLVRNDVETGRKLDFETTPRGSHGGK